MLEIASISIVLACWFVFVLSFYNRKQYKGRKELKVDLTAKNGILMQGLAYLFMCWFRPIFRDSVDTSFLADFMISCFAAMLAIYSAYLVNSSVKELGKQWALHPTVIEGHELITGGTYAMARHPIYTGMFGMLVATGALFAQWYAFIIGLILFFIGTQIRINVEERLLIETFDDQYRDYAAEVPALFPRRLFPQRTK